MKLEGVKFREVDEVDGVDELKADILDGEVGETF